MTRVVGVAALAAIAALVGGCGTPAPSAPCLGDAPMSVTLQRPRFEIVTWEAESDLELLRFVFQPADEAPGAGVTVTAEPIEPGIFLDARFGEPVVLDAPRLTSIAIDGLVGGADSDSMTAGAADPFVIRGIVQVKDDDVARWIVGTVEDVCLRLNANESSGLVVLAVTKD
jgi:hypothetical protein